MKKQEKLLDAIDKVKQGVKSGETDNFLLITSDRSGITLLKNDTVSALGLSIAAEEQLRQNIKDMGKLRQAISMWNRLDEMTNQIKDVENEDELKKTFNSWMGEMLND